MKPLGQLTVICGSMFAGESEGQTRLIRRVPPAYRKRLLRGIRRAGETP